MESCVRVEAVNRSQGSVISMGAENYYWLAGMQGGLATQIGDTAILHSGHRIYPPGQPRLQFIVVIT
jgi:hypothetical protein